MNQENLSIVKYSQLDFGRLELRSDDILCWNPSDGKTTISLEELKLFRDAACELADGEPKLFLSNNKKLDSLGYTERKFIGDNLHQFAKASAIIENSAVIRFIGHTIQGLFPPKVPMKMFSSETQALKWLKSF